MAAAGSSRFAATCGLLQQYMREHQRQKQQIAALLQQAPPPPPAVEETDDGRTLQLFPLHAGMPAVMPLPSQERPEETAPLGIIYDGWMYVFQNYPAEKVRELIKVAWSSSTSQAPEMGAPAVPETPAATEPSEETDLQAIARKASLQRFLWKRKYRRNTAGPYHRVAPENDVAAGKPAAEDELAASWLRL